MKNYFLSTKVTRKLKIGDSYYWRKIEIELKIIINLCEISM